MAIADLYANVSIEPKIRSSKRESMIYLTYNFLEWKTWSSRHEHFQSKCASLEEISLFLLT